jgi:hypothetical protein
MGTDGPLLVTRGKGADMTRLLAVAVCVWLGMGTPAGAGPLVQPTSPTVLLSLPPATVGWQFETTVAFTLEALGVMDTLSPSGLEEDHPVGLWTAGGVLLASVVVTNTNSSPVPFGVAGRWLFTPIGPMLLPPGSYQIGAFYPLQTQDEMLVGVVPPTPGVTFLAGVYSEGPTLAFQATPLVVDPQGFFGPNALVTPVTPMPEPATLLLLAGAGVSVVARHSRRGRLPKTCGIATPPHGPLGSLFNDRCRR